MTIDEKLAELDAFKAQYMRAVAAATAAAERGEKGSSAWDALLADLSESETALADAVRRLTIQ